MKSKNILVAQGRGSMPGIADVLSREGAAVTRCSGEEPGGDFLGRGNYDLLLVDLRNSFGKCPPVAEAFRRLCPQAPIVVAAAEGTGSLALEALRQGYCHFVVQPQNDDHLRKILQRVSSGAVAGGMTAGEHAEGRPTLYEMEKNYILRTLEECKWNKKKTASVLGINRSSLYSKIKRFGIGAESMN